MGKEFLNNYVTETPPPYQFKLTNSEDKVQVLDIPPMEWADGFLQGKRRLKVGGVFISFNIDSLTFIKKGYDFIRKEFAVNGLNSIITMDVFEFNEETREYEAFPTSFAADFEKYKLIKVGSAEVQIGVNIQMLSAGNIIKFDKRKKTDVDITKNVSIGGFEIVPYTNLLKDINIPGIDIRDIYRMRIGAWGGDPNPSLPRLPGFPSYTSIPMGFTGSRGGDSEYYSDFAEATIVPHIKQRVDLSEIPAFFDTALFQYNDLTFDYRLVFNVSDSHSGTPPWDVHLYEVDPSDDVITDIFIGSFGNSRGSVVFDDTIIINITEGNSLKLAVLVRNIQDIAAQIVSPDITMTQKIASSPAKTLEGFPIYEAFERSLQHILDSQYPFYSEKFGRTDTVYNLNNDTYASEDQKTFISILGGLNFRGAPLSDTNAPVPVNFEDLFQSATSMYNLGYTFEERDGFFRLRMEDYSFFFDDGIILDLSDRLTDLDLEGETIPEIAYLDIESGYKNFEYIEVNGRGEFNSLAKRTSIINTATKFDNVSQARGDTKGMTTLLADPIEENGTKDQKGDNDLFFLKTQRDGSGWKPEKGENITIEDDSSIFKDDTFNLFLTPTRNLFRQGNKLKSSLIKFVGSFLRFQVSEKLQTLKTTGEGYTITENDDILVSDLEDPIFLPFKWNVTIKMTFAERKLLTENPFKRIKLTENISGWILEYKRKNATDEVELTIIEKYVN